MMNGKKYYMSGYIKVRAVAHYSNVILYFVSVERDIQTIKANN